MGHGAVAVVAAWIKNPLPSAALPTAKNDGGNLF